MLEAKMSWLKFDTNTPEKPEVLAITIELGWDDPDLTVGKLLKVWRWFDEHSIDGNAKSVTPTLLDRIIGVTGITQAMINAGWLQVLDDGLSLSKFENHNGKTAKDRAETAGRVAKYRAKTVSEPDKIEKVDTIRRNIIPRHVRASVFARDFYTCVYCGRKEGEYAPPEMARDAALCVDHVVPVTRGGADDVSNFVTACSVCNMFKSDRTPDECGFKWPTDLNGVKIGNTKSVTTALPREEKRREDEILKTKEQRGSRLASDWVLLKSWGDWATNERPDLDIRRTADDFRDYWHSVAGSKGIKLDWQATWRVWVRGQRATVTKLSDVARQTVPSSGEHEKTRETIAKTFEGAKPPTLEQLALLASIRGSK
jgi:5-methylcytosine-specific restriction endonuclease McrA